MNLRRAVAVWRGELAVMLRAPILYVVGGLFLVVQGFAFAGLVGALSDPRRPALVGALLEGQLAGSLLTWVLELVVLTLLGMRAIADDGAWESLITAGVTERAAVIAKWLAATTLYALIWLPTLAYFAVVAVFRGDGGGWDPAAIAVGYAGAIAIGAALLAWAIAASAATSSLLASGALGFAFLIALLLVGELGALWPTLAVDHPALTAALDAVSLRRIATDFARGQIGLDAVAFLVGLAVVGLSLAVAWACAGRRRASELRRRWIGTAALAAIAALSVALAARHPRALDVSAARRNSLAAATRDVLAEVGGPARIAIIEPTYAALAPIYDEVARVAQRMADAAPSLVVQRLDPAQLPGGLVAAARLAGLAPGDLAAGGAIVVALGERQRVIDLLAFAAIDRGADGTTTVEQLAIEQALAGALAALAMPRPLAICATTGHGERALAASPAQRDWSMIAARLRGDGMTVDEVAIAPEVPASCAALLVAGPTSPLSPAEALAIQQYVQRGGGLVLAAEVDTATGATPPTGLEGMLAADGIGLPPAIAVDPSLGVRELDHALHIVDGYSKHAINAGFAGARATLWLAPRAVTARPPLATPLISASAASWGERDLVEAPRKDDDDLAGPVAIAAVSAARRIVVIGSAESLSARVLALGAANELWFARAVRWAANAPEQAPAIAARAPDQLRLIMTDGERRAVIALCVGGIPLAWALLGGLVVSWRRRRVR